ncbi:3-ketosteroid reductase [Colletotrichum tofieldiae]|uniref:3-ketosteroid reductase n=1 Tax=Colletotrichum tofieldiae TaxID=708197 RepID=A0A166X3T5_9PEZI|nr:3-ketosteroid reductase [Colletotrichum tofieldiae]GKT57812.1 3-ketosteroid reductase [Colletotrichum tofieldiae]GKT77372.1 3-ketosteroid reductase [Colletotrichum tofieldiae]GKT86228.1 3-ketosteroid reductase [Colletotrichum tofieldiae]
MIAAPWDKASPREQLFVLVTGANSGVGLGICERLIDDFLATRPLTAHLILIPTTRSVRKSRETISSLRDHLHHTATTSPALRSRAGSSYYNPADTLARVHLLSTQLDLCDLPSVYACAANLVSGTITDPTDTNTPTPQYKIPRLDSVIFNAGFGGWTGLDWAGLFTDLFTKGLLSVLTWPSFKLARPGAVLNQRPVRSDLVPTDSPDNPLSLASAYDTKPSSPVLGEVFCANVFGHYVFAHELLALLSRATPEETPGRVVWTSSIEPLAQHFRLDDFQGVETEGPYESSKRLTDVLSLTSHLPATRKFSKSYFEPEDPKVAQALPVRPSLYLTHPGVVASNLFPVPFPFILFWAYKFALYLARWLGSPWHPVTGYNGAAAPVWIALQDDETLAELDAKKIKWGSATSFSGRQDVKKTEVEGWGWEGAVEDRDSLSRDPATGVLRKVVGRNPNAKDLSKEQLAEFEELGAKIWAEMERLRHQWEDFLDIRGQGVNGHGNGKSG